MGHGLAVKARTRKMRQAGTGPAKKRVKKSTARKLLEQELKAKMKRIEGLKTDAAQVRDKLRYEIDDLEGIIESLNTAIEEIDNGMDAMKRGVDTMSQYV